MDDERWEDMLFGQDDEEELLMEDERSESGNDILFNSRKEIEGHFQGGSKVTSPSSSPRTKHEVVTRIESILENIIGSLLANNEALSITLKSRASLSRRRGKESSNVGSLPEPKERTIKFPGANAQEAWHFTVLVRILELIHSGLVGDTISTKRDIYYRHPALFVKQSVVDRYVDDIACTLGTTRSQLNVTAAAKGLVAGNFLLRREDGQQINGMVESQGMLVPVLGEKDIIDLTRVHWILILEKDATFRSLLSSASWKDLGSQSLVMTAKGYPDIASRNFIRHLVDHVPHVPVYLFVDYDPDGIAILLNYKHGSYRLAHENLPSIATPSLNASQFRWLGIKSGQLGLWSSYDYLTNATSSPKLRGLMKLTARDRTKASQVLEWNLCGETGPEQECRRELQNMLMLNIKAEMQILDETEGGLVSWLCKELEGKKSQQGSQKLFDSPESDDGMLL